MATSFKYFALAAQMWLLGRLLPIMIGDLVPEGDDKWVNFLLLMKIVDWLFCPKITPDDVGYLATLITEHHYKFVDLYPDASKIPKIHFILHMPRLILQ